MIQAEHVTKIFRSASQPKPHIALNDLSCTIPGGCIYGLVGSNGAGKSTFLRLLSGVYRPDEGLIEIDGLPVWENPEAKNKIFYVPDDLYFLPQTNMKRMASYYKALYTKFNRERFDNLTETFGLGAEALTDHVFLAQLLNTSGEAEVGTNVDAITGATVTSKAVVRSVNSAVAFVTGADTESSATSWGG